MFIFKQLQYQLCFLRIAGYVNSIFLRFTDAPDLPLGSRKIVPGTEFTYIGKKTAVFFISYFPSIFARRKSAAESFAGQVWSIWSLLFPGLYHSLPVFYESLFFFLQNLKQARYLPRIPLFLLCLSSFDRFIDYFLLRKKPI